MRSLLGCVALLLCSPFVQVTQGQVICNPDDVTLGSSKYAFDVNAGTWFDESTLLTVEYPKGSGRSFDLLGGLYASSRNSVGIWQYSAPIYDNLIGSYHYGSGPLHIYTGNFIDSSGYFCQPFLMSQADIRSHLLDMSDGHLNNPLESILAWPGRYNPRHDEDLLENYGPYFENYPNSNNHSYRYEPTLGDFPLIFSDNALYVWSNDNPLEPGSFHRRHTAFCEQQLLIQTYDAEATRPKTLHTTYRVTIRTANRGRDPLEIPSISFQLLPRIGCPEDDAVGTIPRLNTIFIYNRDLVDGAEDSTCAAMYQSYGTKTPIVALRFLGPHFDFPQSVLNIDTFENSTVPVSGSNIPSLDPQDAQSVYHRTHGRWSADQPLVAFGNGYDPTVSGQDTVRWIYTGDPSVPGSWSGMDTSLTTNHPILFNTVHTRREHNEGSLTPGETRTLDYAVFIIPHGEIPYFRPTNGGLSDTPGPSLDAIAAYIERATADLLSVDAVTSVKETMEARKLNAYPNPTSRDIRIDLPSDVTFVHGHITNLNGQRVHTFGRDELRTGTGLLDLSLQHNGLYEICLFAIDGQTFESRIVVNQ